MILHLPRYIRTKIKWNFSKIFLFLWVAYFIGVAIFIASNKRKTSGSMDDKPLKAVDIANCTRPLEHELDHEFVQVTKGLFIYSVYWDTRPNDFDNLNHLYMIRMLALVNKRTAHQRPRVYCIIPLPSGENSVIEADYYEMNENHGMPDGSYILTCKVKTQNLVNLPCRIGISSKWVKIEASNIFRIHKTDIAQKYDFTLCIPPMFGDLSLLRLIEFIELSQILGAEQFFFYNTFDSNTSPLIEKALDYYEKIGVAKVLPWKLPEGADVWNHGQLLAAQDCLYRNMAISKYIMFHDLDEMLIPRLYDSWPELMQTIDHDDVSGFSFASAYFDPMPRTPTTNWGNAKSQLMSLLSRRRTELSDNIRTKILVKPHMIFEVGIHHISKSIMAYKDVDDISLPVALLHHYRVCLLEEGCEEKEVDDTVKTKYGKQLESAVEERIEALEKGGMTFYEQ